MSDSLIRDLLVNVKQAGAAKATTSINKLNTALVAVNQSTEGVNTQLTKLEASLSRVSAEAKQVYTSLSKISSIKSFSGLVSNVQSLNKQLDKLNTLSTAISTTMVTSLNKVSSSVNKVNTNIAKMAVESSSAVKSTSNVLGELNTRWATAAKSVTGFNRSLVTLNSGLKSASTSAPALVTSIDSLVKNASRASSSIIALGRGISSLNVGTQISTITGLASALVSIASGPGSKAPEVLVRLATALKAAASSSNSFKSASSAIMELTTHVTSLGAKLQTIQTMSTGVSAALARIVLPAATVNSITALNTQLQALTTSSSTVTTGLVTNFGKVNSAISRVNTNIKKFNTEGVSSINSLANAASTLSSAWGSSANSISTIARNVGILGSNSRTATTAMQSLSRPLTSISTTVGKASSGISNLATALGRINIGTQAASINTLATAFNSLSTGGASKAAESVNKLVAALKKVSSVNSSSFGPLVSSLAAANTQLNTMESKLQQLRASASAAASAAGKINFGTNINQMNSSLKKLVDLMDMLIAETVHMRESIASNFSASRRHAQELANGMGRSVDLVADRVIDLNTNIVRVNGSLDTLAARGSRANRVLGGTSGSAQGAARQFAKLARDGGGLTMMYASIAANAYVLKAIFDQMRAGDQLNRLNEFGTIVGSMTGTPVQNLAASLQEATNYAVSFEQAMTQASTASAYGFDSKQISEFGLVARRAAAVLGVDMTDALNRVIKGVSKQEIELLDELGVTIRLNDSYAAYVKTLNAGNTGIQYNIDSLTTYQKQQAYANAVVAQSTKNFGHLDDALRATPWELFGANAVSALKQLQMASAKYLEPVIARLNSITGKSIVESLGDAATFQAETNLKIDPKNATAMGEALQNSYDILLKIRKEGKNAAVNAQETQRQIDILQNKKDKISNMDILLNPNSRKEFNDIDTQLQALITKKNEYESSTADFMYNTAKAQETYNNQLERTAKAYPKLAKTAPTTGKLVPNFDELNRFNEANKEFENFKKNVGPDAMASFNDPSAVKNIQSSLGAFNGLIANIKKVSQNTGVSLDQLAEKAGVGVKTFKELETRVSTMGEYTKVLGNESANNLAVEKERNRVLQAGGKTKDANIAAEKIHSQQLNSQIATTKAMLALQPGNVALTKQLNELETEKLKSLNTGLGSEEKVAKIRTKAIGIEQQIALAKDRSMDADQYQLATLQAQLDVDKQKAEALKNAAEQQADYKTQLLAIAQTERQIRDLNYQQTLAVSERITKQRLALQLASGEYTEREKAAMEILNIEQQIADLRKAAASPAGNSANNVAEDKQKIQELTDELEVLRTQAKTNETAATRGMMDTTTGLLGGTYGSMYGMSPDQKIMQQFQNSQDGYAEALSNLQSINSEATNAATSVGNLVNALMQYSQGSLDFTSMAAAGMQTVSQMISYSSNQQVSAIDAAIAAEQARDGKSDESKAKLKKLEAEKLKVQQDAAKKQILIQTAVAVMQAATAVPYPFSIPLMVAAAAAGAMSYAQASNASSSSLSGLDSGSSTASSLTLGDRNKSVDISQQANSGEISFMQGARGTGNANTFIPRAEGGTTVPGVSYLGGEHGIEVMTPNVPSKVIANDELKKGSTSSRTPLALHINAIDAKSFEAFAMERPEVFRAAVEVALNENGTSLDRLKN